MPADDKKVVALPHGWQRTPPKQIACIFVGSSAPQGDDFFSASGALFVRVSDLAITMRRMRLSAERDK